MARVHLFEIEDQSWCPRTIRESTTDFLLGLYNFFNIYEPAFHKISEVLTKTQSNSIIDCCSGSGGTLGHLREYLDQHHLTPVTITLTDKYPNQEAFDKIEATYPNKMSGYRQSVDASQFPSSLKGMRTFFSSFHHFTPDQALRILQDAVDHSAPIGIFECTQRHPADFIRMLISPIMMLFIMPLAKRLNWRKFLFTYILPVTLVTNMWDYFVSNMRTYSSEELHALIKQLNAPDYTWEVGKLWSKKAMCHIPYLIGHKKSS